MLLISVDRVINIIRFMVTMVNLNPRNQSDFAKILMKAKVEIESSANLMCPETDRLMHGVCLRELVLAASLFNLDLLAASFYFSLSPCIKT